LSYIHGNRLGALSTPAVKAVLAETAFGVNTAWEAAMRTSSG
jgi:hypothetical protein